MRSCPRCAIREKQRYISAGRVDFSANPRGTPWAALLRAAGSSVGPGHTAGCEGQGHRTSEGQSSVERSRGPARDQACEGAAGRGRAWREPRCGARACNSRVCSFGPARGAAEGRSLASGQPRTAAARLLLRAAPGVLLPEWLCAPPCPAEPWIPVHSAAHTQKLPLTVDASGEVFSVTLLVPECQSPGHHVCMSDVNVLPR